MTLEEIRAVLHRAAAVRMPRFDAETGPRERVEILEDYLNLTAVTRGELEEARLYAQGAQRALNEEWNRIEGWEVSLRRRKADATQADVAEAKRECRPELADGLDEARWLVDRLGEQIRRLGGGMGDDQVASRLYTFITSG